MVTVDTSSLAEPSHITVARGKTFDHRETLKGYGFRWNPNVLGGVWTKDPPLDPNEIHSLSRLIASMEVEIKNIRREYLEND